MTVEKIKKAVSMIHYGAGHDEILFLLSELERRDEENRKLREEREQLICIMPSEMAAIDQERETLIEGLRLYHRLCDCDWGEGFSPAEILKSIGIDI